MKWKLGFLVCVLTCTGCLPLGCSNTRWKAEDGQTTVRHGLVIRFGTEIYIGDDGHGETTANWGAEGGSEAGEE